MTTKCLFCHVEAGRSKGQLGQRWWTTSWRHHTGEE